MLFAGFVKENEGDNILNNFLNANKIEREVCMKLEIYQGYFICNELSNEDRQICIQLNAENRETFLDIVDD